MRYGESHQRTKYSDSGVELARGLHDAGMAVGEIARKLEPPYHTVRDWVMYMTRTGGRSYRQESRRAA